MFNFVLVKGLEDDFIFFSFLMNFRIYVDIFISFMKDEKCLLFM